MNESFTIRENPLIIERFPRLWAFLSNSNNWIKSIELLKPIDHKVSRLKAWKGRKRNNNTCINNKRAHVAILELNTMGLPLLDTMNRRKKKSSNCSSSPSYREEPRREFLSPLVPHNNLPSSSQSKDLKPCPDCFQQVFLRTFVSDSLEFTVARVRYATGHCL